MIIECDSSKVGWGAVLKQLGPDGAMHPCVFASGKFNKAQSWALWRPLSTFEGTLHGTRKLYSERTIRQSPVSRPKIPVIYLSSRVDGLPRLWTTTLGTADALSRTAEDEVLSDEDAEQVRVIAAAHKIPIMDNLRIDWEREQRLDPHLAKDVEYLEGKLPRNKAIDRRLADFFLENGVLFRRFADDVQKRMRVHVAQRVVPKHLVERLIDVIHKGYPQAHLGVDATYWKLKQQFFWTQMYSDVVRHLKRCECELTKVWKVKPGFMVSVRDQVTRPFEKVGLDIAGPLPTTKKGFRYFLVMVDLFSGWVELVPLKNVKANTVLKAVMESRSRS